MTRRYGRRPTGGCGHGDGGGSGSGGAKLSEETRMSGPDKPACTEKICDSDRIEPSCGSDKRARSLDKSSGRIASLDLVFGSRIKDKWRKISHKRKCSLHKFSHSLDKLYESDKLSDDKAFHSDEQMDSTGDSRLDKRICSLDRRLDSFDELRKSYDEDSGQRASSDSVASGSNLDSTYPSYSLDRNTNQGTPESRGSMNFFERPRKHGSQLIHAKSCAKNKLEGDGCFRDDVESLSGSSDRSTYPRPSDRSLTDRPWIHPRFKPESDPVNKPVRVSGAKTDKVDVNLNVKVNVDRDPKPKADFTRVNTKSPSNFPNFFVGALARVLFGRRVTGRGVFLLPLLLCCFLVLGVCAVDANGEADYTLDESFWNEENPVGEVERLLREYRQNQELVRNIGAHYYQIIYPVQLRHHEKMGISTREIGSTKLSQRTHQDSGNYQGGTRGRSRTGKHFHRTSLLIKAFNHKFRLDLELNTQLLAPNIIQKHFLATGAEQESRQEIEHCYYHGTVKDYPGASAAFHTCNGVSGVIHVGNETFVIHPFYGGDLSKHPHVIFEARTKANKGCANSGRMELRGGRRDVGFHSPIFPGFDTSRSRRDVREATKYIETALVIDKAMFDKRNGSTRAEVVHDAIQVANIADLYFRTLNTRVSVVYVETWQGSDQAVLDRKQDISRALYNFNDYTSRNLYKFEKDTTQLLTGETFLGGESGMAEPRTVCTTKSVGISVDINTYEPHLLAGTVAHMIGHNIGMGHDDGREKCVCRDWHGCIMAQSIVGLENVQPYKFSECSRSDYFKALSQGGGMCLMNKPNELEVHRNCGNGVVEDGEECDCGLISECEATDPCCDAITCKLKKEAECAAGPCCDNCRLVAPGTICRQSVDECDLPEHCTGESGACPKDVHMRDGVPCGGSGSDSSNPQSENEDQQPVAFCFAGVCPTLSAQCSAVWGYGATPAGAECYEQFNSRGSISGHCGYDQNADGYVKCARDHVRCGSLQCSMGTRHPVLDGMVNQSKTIISIKGIEYECKTSSGRPDSSQSSASMLGLVRDGTSCGTGKMCVNQTCVRIPPSIMGRGNCPVGLIDGQNDPGTSDNDQECSGNGVCTNMDKCYCYPGWRGADCSERDDLSVLKGDAAGGTEGAEQKPPDIEMKMEKKETAYGEGGNNNLSTLTMVFILVAVVKGVFISFALMAVCYRRKSTSMPAYRTDPPYAKKMAVSRHHSGSGGGPEQHMGGGAGGGHPHGGVQAGDHRAMSREDLAASLDGVAKMLSFANAPTYRADSQRVLFRPMNHTGAGSSRFQDHKLQQQMKRLGVGSGSEEDPGHMGELTCNGTLRRVGSSGVFVPIPNGTGSVVGVPGANDEETVSFIDLPLVRGAGSGGERVPEKGILKKHYSGGGSERWVAGECCDSQSDNGAEDALSNAGLTPAETLALSDMLSGLHRHHHRSASGSQTPTANLQGSGGTNSADVERALRSLNGYHDDIIEALRGASAHRGDVERSGSQRDLQDVMNATGQYVGDHSGTAQPIRIRNLEDLIRQLEHHSARHALSPSGSEMDAGGGGGTEMGDTSGRLAPPQAGHVHGMQPGGAYRMDSAACSESSQGSNQHLSTLGMKTATILPSYSASRCRPRVSPNIQQQQDNEQDNRFVYGRYRHPPQGPGQTQTLSRHSSSGLYPSAVGSHTTSPHSDRTSMHPHSHGHHQHSGGQNDDQCDALYESADSNTNGTAIRQRCRDDTPDSESSTSSLSAMGQ